MKTSIGPALLRLLRVLIAGAIAGAICAAQKEMSGWVLWLIIQPAITALISALNKYIRDKWGIELPL